MAVVFALETACRLGEIIKLEPQDIRGDLLHLRFHDTRHEAISRMALKINNPLMLAKISGHKDLKILLNTYYNPNGSDLVGLLD